MGNVWTVSARHVEAKASAKRRRRVVCALADTRCGWNSAAEDYNESNKMYQYTVQCSFPNYSHLALDATIRCSCRCWSFWSVSLPSNISPTQRSRKRNLTLPFAPCCQLAAAYASVSPTIKLPRFSKSDPKPPNARRPTHSPPLVLPAGWPSELLPATNCTLSLFVGQRS